MVRPLLALVLAASLSGCYALGLNARGYTKPVSVSATVGQPATVVRHFRHEVVTWYLFGVVPFATLPGSTSPWLPADRLVAETLHQELARSGDGIVNLRVTRSITPVTAALTLVPAGTLSILPGSSPWVGGAFAAAFQPVAVTIEGDVVSFAR